jgi:uncharacterized protein YbjQ (UPF0145 family)
VSLFGTPGDSVDDDGRQRAQGDLERITRGGIPLGAEERLKRIAAGTSAPFTSDLSAKEYALAQASGLTPMAQIMGSSVVQTGWQDYVWAAGYARIVPVPSFSEPWNIARQRAFDRLRQEAQFAGADAVIGIEMDVRTLPEQRGVEYVVFGTAVRETIPVPRRDSGPRMCALSGQDFVVLRRIGAEPVAVIGHTAVVGVTLSAWASQRMGTWWGNEEMAEITQGVYMARRMAMDEVRRQASAAGASEMVVSDLTHRITRPGEQGGGSSQNVFIIIMQVLGTAIIRGAHEPRPAPLGPLVMSINIGD